MSDKQKEDQTATKRLNESINLYKKELYETLKTPEELENIRQKLAKLLMRKGHESMKFKKNYVESMNEFTESLRLNPSSECFCLRGYLFGHLGFFSIAIADFEKGLEIAKNKKDIEDCQLCIAKFKSFLN